MELVLKLSLKLILLILRTPNEIAGTLNKPYPWSAPFIVWSNIVNNIVKELIWSIKVPSLAFGYNKSSIGPANIHIPTVHGNPISKETRNEKVVFLFIVFLSLFAFATEIAGTNAVANATFIESGKLVKVSTFPPNIPYCATATSSGKNSFKLLTTVKESIFLFTDERMAVIAIGSDTNTIFFTILLTRSYL